MQRVSSDLIMYYTTTYNTLVGFQDAPEGGNNTLRIVAGWVARRLPNQPLQRAGDSLRSSGELLLGNKPTLDVLGDVVGVAASPLLGRHAGPILHGLKGLFQARLGGDDGGLPVY
jgi:hypothetical protein